MVWISVLDVAPLNLNDELVQTKCEKLLRGQTPSLSSGAQACWIWRVEHIAEVVAVCGQAVRETACMRTPRISKSGCVNMVTSCKERYGRALRQ